MLLVLHLSLLLLPAYAPKALGAGRSSGDVPVRQHPNFPTQGKLLDGLPALLAQACHLQSKNQIGTAAEPLVLVLDCKQLQGSDPLHHADRCREFLHKQREIAGQSGGMPFGVSQHA